MTGEVGYRRLVVWQKADELAFQVYQASKGFPRDELYGLTSQLRRAALSVPANIAEGFRKRSKQDKARFLNISEGSLEECRYYLMLAHDLGILDKRPLWELTEEVGRLLNAYRSAILTPNS